MYDWTVLDKAVSMTLDSGRIGMPVFVRWTAAVAERMESSSPQEGCTFVDSKAQLAAMVVCTSRWLKASVRRLYVSGTETQGHLSLTVEYTTGSSALLALTLAHNRPHINLAIYGNLGALYHNEELSPYVGSLDSSRARAAEQEVLVILEAMNQSLTMQQPSVLSQAEAQP